MRLTPQEKADFHQRLVACLGSQAEVRRIVVFGSFANSDDPQDLDVAVFQEGSESSLPLALRYRRLTRTIARQIPLDIFPVRAGLQDHLFLREIDRGVTIYAR